MFIWRFPFTLCFIYALCFDIKCFIPSPRVGTFLCEIALYLLLMFLGELKQRQTATAAIKTDAVHGSLDRDGIYLAKKQINQRQ